MPPALIGYFSRDAAAAAFGYSGGVARESTQLRVELASLSEVLQEWTQYLVSTGERERHRALIRPEDRDRFLLGSCLVRAAVSDATGLAPGGPPAWLPNSSTPLPGTLVFREVAVAISTARPVGVDAEQIDPGLDPLTLADIALPPEERDYLRSLSASQQAASFCTHWTRTEAMLKTTGDGLRRDPADLVVTASDQPAQVVAWAGRPGHGAA
jgi:4'-phosphopantetheinyl transferase